MTVQNVIRRTVELAGVDATSTGDSVLFRPVNPVDVLRWGFIAQALLDVGAGAEFSIDHRPTIGSDTSRAEIGQIDVTADVAAGAGQYQNIIGEDADGETPEDSAGEASPLRYVAPTGPFQVDPGGEIVFDVDNAADTADTILVWVEMLEYPIVGTRIANLTKVTDA